MADRELNLQIKFDAVDKASGKLKALTAEGKALAAGIGAAKQKIKELDQTQKVFDKFVVHKKRTRELRVEMDAARQKASALGKEIASAEKPTRALTRAFESAKREAAKAERTWQSNAAALNTTRDKLAATGYATNQLVSHQRALKSRTDEATASMKRQQKALAEGRTSGSLLQDRPGKTGASITGAMPGGGISLPFGMSPKGAGAAAAAAVAGDQALTALKGAANIEYAMKEIGVIGDLSAKQLEDVEARMRRISTETGRTLGEIITGVKSLTALGVAPETAISILNPSARASRAFSANTDDMSRASLASITKFNMVNLDDPNVRQEDVQRASVRANDKIAFSAKRGPIEPSDISRVWDSLSTSYSTLAKMDGMAMSRLLALAQTSRKTAGTNDEALNNTINFLDTLSSPETKSRFAGKGIDIDSIVRKAKIEGTDAVFEIINQIKQKIGTEDLKLGEYITDRQARKGAQALANYGGYYQSTVNDIETKSSGSVEESFVDMMASNNARWDQITARWENFTTGLAAKALPDVGGPKKSGSANMTVGPLALTMTALPWLAKIFGPSKPAAAKGGAAEASSQRQTNAIWVDRLKKIESVDKKVSALQPAIRSKSMQIGHALPTGIAAGIDAGMPVLDAKLAMMAARMQAQPKSILEIRSPSRVFARMGRDVVAGLTQGIDRHGADPAAAMQRVASSMTPGFPTLSPGVAPNAAFGARSGPSGAPITVNIYGAQGQDVQALADIVVRKIGDARGVAERSSFDDGY